MDVKCCTSELHYLLRYNWQKISSRTTFYALNVFLQFDRCQKCVKKLEYHFLLLLDAEIKSDSVAVLSLFIIVMDLLYESRISFFLCSKFDFKSANKRFYSFIVLLLRYSLISTRLLCMYVFLSRNWLMQGSCERRLFKGRTVMGKVGNKTEIFLSEMRAAVTFWYCERARKGECLRMGLSRRPYGSLGDRREDFGRGKRTVGRA